MEMLAAVNDSEATSEELLSAYFNEENLLTYAAITILMGNVEGTVKDYLIYSPQNSKTWYFIPEDFRNAFESSEWQSYAFLMNNKIFRMYLKEEENRIKLSDKIAELRLTFTDDWVTEKLAGYKENLLPYIYSMPEIIQLPIPAAEVEPYISKFVENLAQTDTINYTVLPPYIEGYTREGNRVDLRFDSQQDLTYYAEISTDRRFSEITETVLISDGSFNYEVLGSYYLRVVGVTSDGERIVCGNIDLDSLGRTIYGGVEIN
jgi:spore coat protein H